MSVAVVAIAVSDTLRYLAAIESRLCRLPPGVARVCACHQGIRENTASACGGYMLHGIPFTVYLTCALCPRRPCCPQRWLVDISTSRGPEMPRAGPRALVPSTCRHAHVSPVSLP